MIGQRPLRKLEIFLGQKDKKPLIDLVARLDPLEMPALRFQYEQHGHTDLENDIIAHTRGHFQDCLLAIVRGPLKQGVVEFNAAKIRHSKLGDEDMLFDVVLGRSNADLATMKVAYSEAYGHTFESKLPGLPERSDNVLRITLEGARYKAQTADNDRMKHWSERIYRATEMRRS